MTAFQKEPSCKWMNCLLAEKEQREKSARQSQFDAYKDKNGTFSVEGILIIWDAFLMCKSKSRELIRGVVFCSRGIYSASDRCRVLQKSSGQSAGAVKWIAGLAGWSSDRRQKFVMDILSWMTALRFQVEPVSFSNLWNHSPTKTEEQRRHHGVPPCLWEIRSKCQTSASLPFTMLSSPFADLLQLILIKSYKFGVTVDVWKFLIARTSHLWRHAVLPRQPCMLI